MGRITETIKVLIIINVLFFVGTLVIGDLAYRLFALYYVENPNFQYWQVVTHMFMHGGFIHILFNMYALWAFGTPLEMRWGQKRFLFFYFSAGLGAALIHTLVNYFHVHTGMEALLAAGFDPAQITDFLITGKGDPRIFQSVPNEVLVSAYTSFNTPAVGASGAIYGVLVAFGMMFPNIELMLIFFPIPIKAKYFIPLIIVGDVFFGLTGAQSGVAHWAHVGGALFGFIMAWYWKRNSFDNHRWN